MTSAPKAQALSDWARLEAWTRNWNSSPEEGQEIVLAEPPSPTRKGARSLPEQWPVFERPPDVEEEPEQED